jgi:hypothetical protein
MILPAISGRPMRYHRWLYSHVVLLHVSLVLRVAADLTEWSAGTTWGGSLNAAALGLFMLNTAWATVTARQHLTGGGTPTGVSSPAPS